MVCLDRLRLVLRPLLVAGLLCVGGAPREARAADGDAAGAASGAAAGAAATRELEIGSAPRDPAAPAPWIPGGRGLPTVGNGVGLPDAAGAGPGTDKRRARADRRVARFDFEETNDVGVKLGRGVPLPPGWYAVGRPPQSSDANFARLPLHADLTGRTGFPPYNPVGYSQVGRGRGAVGAGNDPGGYALHLGLRGGNSAAFVQVGRLPVVPGTRYRVTAAVRTAGLEHAAARVVGFYVDAQGNRLGESVRKTARTQTRGAWREVELVLDGTAPRAAYLGLQVELVQPVADELNPLGEHQVVRTDVAGDAWFDDLEVVQLPQVRVVSDSPVGVVRSSSAPGWTVSVRDLRGERLVAQLSLYDADARRVAYEERPLDWGAAARWRWAPPLPGYGYYRAVLRIAYGSSAQGGAAAAPAVARDSHAVLWLPPAGPLAGGTAADDLKRFALLAEDVGPATLDNLPELVSALGLQTAVVSALARDTAGAAIHERVEVVGRYLDRAESSGLRTEVSLHPLPDELHAGSGPGATLAAVLGGAADRWLGYLQPIVARDGARVAAWHLGGADTGAAAEATAITAPRLAGLTERLRHWTPEPRLVVPGAITGVRPAAAAPGTGVGWQALWPAGLTAASVWELSWAGGGPERGAHRRWVLGLPGPDELSHPQRAAEAAQRVVAAWEQQATAVALDKPWAAESDGGLTRLTPDPVAGVVAQAARRLAGFRAAGRLPLPDGLQAVIFRPAGAFGDGGGGAPSAGETGVLVAWNQRARAERAFIEVAWGPDVRAVDVWGNPAALAQAEPEPEAGPEPADGAPRRVRVPLGDTPVFVTGVDARMLAFRAGFGIDQPFFPARQTPHARTLSLTNPWPVAISGSLTFAGPAGWEALPRQLNFSIPAGATATYPVTLRFPVSAQAGPDLLTVRARFTARGRHDVHLSTPVELGLPGLGFDPQLMVERVPGVDGAPDRLRAVVNCVMANRGTAPVSLGVFATLPGHPRQERLIPRLGPGEAVRRRFVFDDAAAALRAFDVSLGLRENGGAGVLNARVGVERRGAAE